MGVTTEVALNSIRHDKARVQSMTVSTFIRKFVPASTFLAAIMNIEKTPVIGAGSLDALKSTS
jgi:hypothetical protein